MKNDMEKVCMTDNDTETITIKEINNQDDVFKINSKLNPATTATALLLELRRKGRLKVCSIGLANKTALKVFALLEYFIDKEEHIFYKHNIYKLENSNRSVVCVNVELRRDSSQEYKIFTVDKKPIESLVNDIVNDGFSIISAFTKNESLNFLCERR